MKPRIGWIARRARRLMSAFGIKRSKAVRYAYDDWKAFKGSQLTCDELGICQDREDCNCSGKRRIARPSSSMRDFYRFLSKARGEAS